MEEKIQNSNQSLIRHLSILSNPDGFIFSDAEKAGSRTYELKTEAPVDFPERFEEFVRNCGWAGNPWMDVTLTEHTNRFMVMPAAIDDPGQQRVLFDASFTKCVPGELVVHPLSDGKQLFCYEIPTLRLDSYKHLFINLHLFNNAHLLTEWILKQANTSGETTMMAYKYGKNLHIFIASPTQLLFVNAFLTRTTQEDTYFCLRCIEQLNLDPFTLRCFVCSLTEQPVGLTETLRPYIKNIRQAVFTGMPDHPVKLLID